MKNKIIISRIRQNFLSFRTYIPACGGRNAFSQFVIPAKAGIQFFMPISSGQGHLLLIGLLISTLLPSTGKTENAWLKIPQMFCFSESFSNYKSSGTTFSIKDGVWEGNWEDFEDSPARGKTETLLRWNLLSLELNKGHYSEIGAQMELLGVDLFFPKYNFGIGSALLEIIELPSNGSYYESYCDNMTFAPIHLYYLLYYNKWHLGKIQFANTVDCFAEFWLYSYLPSGSFGIEWSPGTLLKLRAAYTDIFQEHKSAFYVSCGLSLGAINILGGE